MQGHQIPIESKLQVTDLHNNNEMSVVLGLLALSCCAHLFRLHETCP